MTERFDATQETYVANDIMIQSLNAKITIDAKTEIYLHCGGSSISMKADGTIKITGKNITISGDNVEVSGTATTKMGSAIRTWPATWGRSRHPARRSTRRPPGRTRSSAPWSRSTDGCRVSTNGKTPPSWHWRRVRDYVTPSDELVMG